MSSLETFLVSCRELSRFCSQNGLIDNQSLRYNIILETGNELFVEVEFDELLLECANRDGERIPCRGQLHLYLDNNGQVTRTEVV
ncbi:MAG TPA: hypothetical protein VLB10_02565 [Gammaproteobacteria bacterium]|jgi:hypothetical protein|nr:hypothetical protein [Gammaproteobacteria bacterium]